MYDKVWTKFQTPVGITTSLPMKVGLHQGSTLSLFIFTVIMKEITKSIWDTVPWCMLFADDIVLVVETKEEVNNKLEEWREILESRGLRISCSDTEYLCCDFSRTSSIGEPKVTIGEEIVAGTTKFKHLRSIILSTGKVDGDVTHRIQAGWLKW